MAQAVISDIDRNSNKTKHQLMAYETAWRVMNLYKKANIPVSHDEVFYCLEFEILINDSSPIENANIDERNRLAEIIATQMRTNRDFRSRVKIEELKTQFIESSIESAKYNENIVKIAKDVVEELNLTTFALFNEESFYIQNLQKTDRDSLMDIARKDFVFKMCSIVDKILDETFKNKSVRNVSVITKSNVEFLHQILVDQFGKVAKMYSIVDRKGAVNLELMTKEFVEDITSRVLKIAEEANETELSIRMTQIREREEITNKREEALDKREQDLQKLSTELLEHSHLLKKQELELQKKMGTLKAEQEKLTMLLDNFKKAYAGIFSTASKMVSSHIGSTIEDDLLGDKKDDSLLSIIEGGNS